MATRKTQRRYAFVMSVLGHAAVVVALTFSLPLSPRQAAAPSVVPIEAVMIDMAAVEAERAKIEEAERIAREEAERIDRQRREEREAREREQEQARIAAEREAAAEADRIRRQREAEDQAEAERVARIEAEQREAERLAEQEQQRREAEAAEAKRREEERLAAERAAEEQRRREEQARIRQQQIEADIAASIADEVAARAAEDAGLKELWARQIENKIQRNWSRPLSAKAGLECVLAVRQLPSGDVVSVSIQSCNGDDVVQRSIVAAVEKASPLPPPPVPELFTRDISVTFKPDE
jgi:colicin import membrane protein